MPSKALTLNEKVIALIKKHGLNNFSVVQLRDLYLKSESDVSANQAYKSIYKVVWLMHRQGVFYRQKIEGNKSFTYSLSSNFKSFLETDYLMLKYQHANGFCQAGITPKINTLIEEILNELSILENEMLAKKPDAQEYQQFLSKLPNHQDMLMTKFNEANTAVVKLLGRITATQCVLSEFK